MSNLPTSKPTFSFGTPATSAGSQTLFGSVTSSSAGGGSFAAPFSAPSSGGGLFNTSGQPSSSLFGAQSTTTAPTPSIFGGASAANGIAKEGDPNTQKPSLFGAGNAAGTGQFSTPNKPSESKAAAVPLTSGIFGGGSQPGGATLFGSLGGTTSGTNQLGATTPAPGKPAGAMFSTTPAGPPPAIPPTAGSTSIFGAVKHQDGKSGLFGALPSAQATTAPAATNNTTTLFGASQPAASASSQAAVQPTANMFGQTSVAGGTNLFAPSNQQDAASKLNTFATTGGTTSATQSSLPTASPSLFGSAQKPLGTTSSTSTPFSFPPSTASSGNTNSAFSSSSATQETAKPNPNSTFDNSPFGASRAEPVAPTVASERPTTTSAPAVASAAPNMTAGAASVNSAVPTAKPTDPSCKEDTSKPTGLASSSTAGTRPSAQSRLKNKSMDEIITRWASDLSKYQKEFQKQALKVAEWDRSIVENAAKIQKLYADTLEAERATSEVERQLSLVENDQEELENWLSHYEKQVDEIIATQVGQGDSFQGPDQERERTFKLAEKLSDRLEEMGKDLAGMVEEINDASSNLSKSSGADDSLSQIVRILNGHLNQLQQIDQGTAAVQTKLAAAQKASRGMAAANSSNGLGSDAADDFYRSYMGRR